MYSILTYPLDVIKTNRILQTSLAKEGAERIPREILSLQERGNLHHGLFRGFMATVLASSIVKVMSNVDDAEAQVVAVGLGTLITNPLHIIQVNR